ncbi:MAG: deoxyribose-phosphate aldolase [Bdellovibrio sp.]|nr:MAG: deoxyribose-phosphate aldolase [Bdellovibrio sp.]
MSSLSPYIEHTLLKPEATEKDIERLCREALEHDFLGVCVNSSYVRLAKSLLEGSTVKLVSVVGFPLGSTMTEAKAAETQVAIREGADEIDMVIHLGALKENRRNYVRDDIAAVVLASQGRPVKVIIETGLLTKEEKALACHLSQEARAEFVKTCTGFNAGQAEAEDVRFMRSIVGEEMGVKASAGIKTAEKAWALIKAGANRIGTSVGPLLVAPPERHTVDGSR